MWIFNTSRIIVALALALSLNHGLGFTPHSIISLSSSSIKPRSIPLARSFQKTARSTSIQAFHSNGLCQPCARSFRCESTTKLCMASSSSTKSKPSITTSVLSTAGLIFLDIAFRRLLKTLNVAFPSSLAGCGALFTTLIALSSTKQSLGDGLYSLLAPGAAVLAKWLPVFFVPSLVTLPLAQSLGSSVEVRTIQWIQIYVFILYFLRRYPNQINSHCFCSHNI